MIPHSSTNLKNRVSKLHLPKTKALLPLFETISNSIHAIQEKRNSTKIDFTGTIHIQVIRSGREEVLKDISNIESYPIKSFQVIDNGIGLNQDNLNSFAEFDSEKKAEIGGKGVGRLICLKAFRKLSIESVYWEDNKFKLRCFDYKKTKDGFENYKDNLDTPATITGTKVTLSGYEENYGKHVPFHISEIAQAIINHFQLYFIQGLQPEIKIINQDGSSLELNSVYEDEFKKDILKKSFPIGDKEFHLYISKSTKAKSHKIHFCAHERNVKDEGLSKYLEDLRYRIKDDSDGYYFQVFVVGKYLDNNVSESRTSFNFSIEESEDEEMDLEEISLAKIRRAAIAGIEELLSEFLQKVRQEKLDTYIPIINEEFPNYSPLVMHKLEEVKKLPVGLGVQELDLKLYEIDNQWRAEVKEKGIEILDRKKDITQLDEYKQLYEEFLEEFNDAGKSDLARYVVHRRSVIDLLDKLIELDDNEKFAKEDIIHSLFYPIRETKESVAVDKQNLWLLDERLTFNRMLSSDKLFKTIKGLNSESNDRMDLVIQKDAVFEDATLFSEEKYPFESFTIVEFKRPERDDYTHGDKKNDPIKQVRSYVQEIIDGKEKLRGKAIQADKSTPFYCYIIADITHTLQKILDFESFDPTPDGLGYFRFYSTINSRVYIEVVPFQKVIRDAKQRNKVLFDQLKLS